MNKDVDDILFGKSDKKLVNPDIKEKKVAKKKVTEARKKKKTKMGIGLDVGTGFLVGAGYDPNDNVTFTPIRDAFFTINKELFVKSMFDKSKMKYVEVMNEVHVVGEDALTLAQIQNTLTKRPLANGVINPSERDAAPILQRMLEFCIRKYKEKDGEQLVFSIPGPKVGDEGFNIEYHNMSITSLIQSLGMEATPLNEGYAVVISELEKSNDVTGLGFSFGAGLVNVAFVYKSMLLFSFSIDKSGDYVDKEASKACGVGETRIKHIKENELDLSANEFMVSAEERALIFTYRYIIKNTINEVIRAFTETSDVNIVEPVPIIISGGTSLPKGFNELFQQEMKKVKMPFEYTEIIPAENRLSSVAKGCLMWAHHLENQKK